MILLIHILAIGIWLGCILVEAAFEHRLPKTETQQRAVADLHVIVDVWIETPAFLLVLVTGSLLLLDAPLGPALTWKVAISFAAVALNAWCVWLVFRRRALFRADRLAEAAKVDHLQHKAGGLLFVLILAALAIGATMFPG